MTDDREKAACDRAIAKAAKLMVGSIGASHEMMLDRLLTFTAAQMVSITGKAEAVEAFQQCAKAVEGGIFDRLDPTAPNNKH
ncbi:hypothetical protein [Paracoccus onubensis]|uniref:Uncharacterized protein n=1 Tax=Paracoccus onubensis TaxID=1675788 RepID=A0A418SRQ7_9RHOB|nr:hypothetical protein [Paracoccus onubensis]RJE83644.1 hypothetical protein D3P04_14620 [Paracoccus onubensis]